VSQLRPPLIPPQLPLLPRKILHPPCFPLAWFSSPFQFYRMLLCVPTVHRKQGTSPLLQTPSQTRVIPPPPFSGRVQSRLTRPPKLRLSRFFFLPFFHQQPMMGPLTPPSPPLSADPLSLSLKSFCKKRYRPSVKDPSFPPLLLNRRSRTFRNPPFYPSSVKPPLAGIDLRRFLYDI